VQKNPLVLESDEIANMSFTVTVSKTYLYLQETLETICGTPADTPYRTN